MMSFNAQQQLAISELDKSMSISAGAGSGKTRVLVERFWNLVANNNVRIDEILAITFTRKAAHELVERIRKRIDEADEDEVQKINLKENLSRAYIGTIHSFCARLLRENPLEAGTDPCFRVIEEFAGAQLLQQTVEEAVLNRIRAGDPDVLNLVELVGYNQLCAELQALTRTLINKGLKLNEIEKTTRASLAAEDKETVNRIIRINQSLTALAELLPAIDEKSKTYSAVQQIAVSYKQWSSLLETINTGENREIAELLEHLADLCKQMKAQVVKNEAAELKQVVEELIGCLADRQTLLQLKTVFKLLNMVAESYQINKDKENILEFSDLEEKAVSLLSNHPLLLQRYQIQFQHIMVDEFQDTNHRQVDLLKLLAGGQHSGKLFLVGDPKQSIYRFRGAEVGLFSAISEKIKKSGGIGHSLDENYRSREQVIEIINNLFEKLMQTGNCPFQKLTAGRKTMLIQPQTELHLIQKDNGSELERDEAEAECLAFRIKEIVGSEQVLVAEAEKGNESLRPVKYGDIALLFRTTRDMNTFAAVFSNYRIPSYIVGSRGFYQAEEVRAVIWALQAVDNRNDELAWAGLLRSPVFGVSDEALWLMKQAVPTLDGAIARLDTIAGIAPAEKAKILQADAIIAKLRQLKNHLSVYELIDMLLRETGFEYILAMRPNGKQMIANLNKLKRLAVSYNHNNFSNLNGFLNYIAELQEAEVKEPEASTATENGDTVKMMTVHQAKGLEFPVVIIPEMQRQFNLQDISRFSIISEEYGIFIKTADHKGLLRQKAESAEKINLEEEYKRLLYVAMTRARDYLILSGYYKIDSKGIIKTDANSWLNWLFIEYGVAEHTFDELEKAGLRVFSYLQSDITTVEQGSACKEKTRGEDQIDKYQVSNIIDAVPEQPYRQFISATAVMDYSFCQRYYYLKHLMGIPETAVSDEYKYDIIVHNLRADKIGTLVHRAIEQSSDLAAAREVLKQLVQVIAAGKNRKDILHDLDTMLAAYYKNKTIQSLIAEYKMQKEVPFLACIDKHTYLRGFIDQLFTGNNRTVIADLKTNQINSASYLDKKIQQYTIQLNVYEEAMRKVLGIKKVDKILFFLGTGQLADVPTSAVNFDLSGTKRTAAPDNCKKCSYSNLCSPNAEQI